MNCLLELCFISSIYVTGSVGVQAMPEFWNLRNDQRTNKYGSNIGQISLVIEFKNNLYIEAKHLSGLDFAEIDNVLNAIMIGAKINFKGG